MKNNRRKKEKESGQRNRRNLFSHCDNVREEKRFRLRKRDRV
jgi:hypothetical protein